MPSVYEMNKETKGDNTFGPFKYIDERQHKNRPPE